ncbi:MAG: DsbA family protein [Gammaproteobacteria bacterium]
MTIVEFFDYQCGYCKKVVPSIQSLLKSDGNIRYVFKEYPALVIVSSCDCQHRLGKWFRSLAGWPCERAKPV